MPKPKTYTYQGNPGYAYDLASGVAVLNPGDVVELTDDEVVALGDDFAPTTAAKAADTDKDPS